jgi:hypothetical protein
LSLIWQPGGSADYLEKRLLILKVIELLNLKVIAIPVKVTFK